MSNTITHLKYSKQSASNRWIVKYDTDGLIREVKLIFNPKEYKEINGSRPLLTRKKLIRILENDKEKRAAK
jgi:hypothetical protein